jgi:hypothetical protein
MRKLVLFSILAVVVLLNAVVPCFALDSGFAVGPAHLVVTVPQNSSNSTYVYITSHVDGELVVGTENLTFLVEPATIPITSTDRNRKVELTVYGNASLAMGEYSGKLTLLLYTGNNVAHGVKLNTNVTQEGPETQPSWLDQLLETIAQNYVIIIAVVGVIVALIIGVYIGKRSKKPSDT